MGAKERAEKALAVIERAVYDDNVVPPHCGQRGAVKLAIMHLRSALRLLQDMPAPPPRKVEF